MIPNANKRILAEKAEIEKESKNKDSSLCNITIGNTSDIYKWTATLVGPDGTPYRGGLFDLNIELSKDYPFKAPKISFKTQIYHPNINNKGDICIDALKDNWKPSSRLIKTLQSIVSLLYYPNPDDPLNIEAANLYKSSRELYDKKVIEYVFKYANGSK